jgi:dynein heavy chain, axonemal
VIFDFEMKSEPTYSAGPDDGVYTYGLFIEGCRWDAELFLLNESLPKILFSPAPVMHFVPYRTADVPIYPHYKCPVYKTSDRRYVALLSLLSLASVPALATHLSPLFLSFSLFPSLCVSSGILATTGHSSNFVCYIHVPSAQPESHWVERGVAMLTQLDD